MLRLHGNAVGQTRAGDLLSAEQGLPSSSVPCSVPWSGAMFSTGKVMPPHNVDYTHGCCQGFSRKEERCTSRKGGQHPGESQCTALSVE